MLTKEEAKELREKFWEGFKKYCSSNNIRRRWLLTGIGIRNTQLKFHADADKALVMFQIDHRNDLRRYEIYESFLPYRKLITEQTGNELLWDEDFREIGRTVSAIYFKLPNVSIYNPDEWAKIYAFFVKKMPILEDIYREYRHPVNENIKRFRS
ncbi:MAG: DUF4268 domain-containing protein [Culturomica sp.]|nr:DUF4268 domain-containing protein [Culturomica sp.]